jgi:serine phosphatase RsbU (regulator of sigma subunit)
MLVAVAGALAASALLCSTAAAQLPELPKVEPGPLPVEPVGELVAQPVGELVPLESVRQLLERPLPSPVEEVVQDSPVAPVREEVQRLVGAATPDPGGGSPDGGGSAPGAVAASSGSPSAGAAPPAEAGGGSDPDAGGGSDPRAPRGSDPRPTRGSEPQASGGSRSPRTARDGSRRRNDEPASRDRQAAGAAPEVGAPPGADPSARRAAAATDDEGVGAITRTVRRIVEVVPTIVWIALAGLAILALALGARALVDNRRARALRSEREHLLHDMGLLERVLLPQVPERLGDLAVSVAYRPAEGPAAGGDFYDVFELSGGRVALLVGDVSGHGREALERTGSLRPTLHAHLEAGTSPRAALQSAARAVGLDANGGFTTVVAAVHDPHSGTLTYAVAGHPPPILVGPGAHEPLTAASSPPMGVGIRTGVRQTTVPLPRGSAACFFTDGLLEARSEATLLGRDWLAGVVARFGPFDSADALLDRVAESADQTPDDMTACLVRAVAGSEAIGPRIEELEVEPDELGSAAPRRFLEACGLSPEEIAAALEDARGVVASAGSALLQVTIDGSEAAASVTAPTPEALATT